MKHIWITLAVGLAVFTLAACGGGDDDADNDAPSATTAEGDQTEEPGDETAGAEEETDEPEATDASVGGFPGAVDACELITSDEAAEVIGSAVDAPQEQFIGEGFHQCLYRIAGGTDLDAAVVIQARGNTSRDDFERLVDENTPEVVGEVTEVPGLGDVAYEQIATFVLEGDTMIVVTVLVSADDSQAQQDLARKAIARIS